MTQQEFLRELAEKKLALYPWQERILLGVLGPVLAAGNAYREQELWAHDEIDEDWDAAWAAACEKLHGKADKRPAS